MTFNTGNPIGSTDARDLSDNAENFDKALGTISPTWVDRFGNTRDSFEGRLAKGSFYRVGTFAAGYTLTNMRQTLEYGGHEYSWAGTFPKAVAAGATPATSGGIGAGAWVDRTDVTLRDELGAASGNRYVGAAASVDDARAITGLSAYQGRRIYLSGYYSADGVGAGDLIITSDTTSADNGGTVFVTTDGVRLKRPRKMRMYSSDFGVVGDWDGTTGTDNKAAIERMISASNSSQPWCINQDNVGVSSISISGKDNWNGIISGSVINISAKPATGATEEKDTAGGLLPTFKITGCDQWTLKGGYVDNRYREAFYIENCAKFSNECDVLGSGINNNLRPNYYRYCTNFKLNNFQHEGTSEKPTVGYYPHCNNINIWDCSNFKILDFKITGTGSNGIYVGSNCKDYLISDFVISGNAMSGIQLAWSSFGTFPYRGTISNGLINGNRADGIDANNTSGSRSRAELTISNITSVNNGYNDDGTVTSDGSGIATLKYVTYVDIIACNTEDPANGGLHINNCGNIKVFGGSVRKEKSTNNEGGGLYIQDSDDITVKGLDVSMYPGKEALKLYGTLARIRIGGKYTGVAAIPTPDANTTYEDVKLKDAQLVVTVEVQGYIPFVDCFVRATGSNALAAKAPMQNTSTYSSSGIALRLAANGVKVRGGRHKGVNSGSYCSGYNYCSIDGAELIGGTGPASHWINAIGSTITNNTITAGTGNAILTDSACTLTQKFGNLVTGVNNLGGTFNINY